MHIAICVWGIVRSLRFTIESIHKYCLDPITNAGHTYEIYMHTYKFRGVYENLRSHERGLRLNFTEWQMLRPDHIYVEDQDIFDKSQNFSTFHGQGDPWKNDFVSFQNHLRAMNSLYYLANQVEKDSQNKHFDGIVYLRPDVTFLNELPFHLLEHLPNTLFVPDFHRSCRGGEYNDRMAMGDLKTGLIYGKKYQAALSYSKRKPLHSEKFVYDYLRTQNVTVKEIPFRFRRTRANGDFHPRDSTAIVAPRNQKPHPTYRTNMALRWVYNAVEELTNHQMYVWNHDDDENLYCKPQPYLSIEEVLHYRKLSRRKRYEKGKQPQLHKKGETSVTEELDEPPEDAFTYANQEDMENAENTVSTSRTRQWSDLLKFGGGGAYSLPPPPNAIANNVDSTTTESKTPSTIYEAADATMDYNTGADPNEINPDTSIIPTTNTYPYANHFANTVYRTFYHNPETSESTTKLTKKEVLKQKRLNKQERRRKKRPPPAVASPYKTFSEFFHLSGQDSVIVGRANVADSKHEHETEERNEQDPEINARQSPYYPRSKAEVTRAARTHPHHKNNKQAARASNRANVNTAGGGAVSEAKDIVSSGYHLRGVASRELESGGKRKNKARNGV